MSLTLAAFLMSGETSAQGMAVPGEASVSETGAARYNIPIAVPPGTAGMVPSLSLSYNSQGGNGLVGMGFSLEGLAAVGRCPRTMATDGVRGSVNYDANDRFCLDGQRLIAISGAYGADGAEYRTEIESFTKVISRGTAGTGPAWFEVWTKSGQRMEFGNTTDSLILAQGKTSARSWAVNKVADTKGNFYTVSYVNDAVNGEAYPSRIDYTGNTAASLTPYNSVRFVYESRPDATTAWHVGSMVKSTVRLSKVQTYAGAALVSDYRLTFAQGTSTGRSQLASITICEAGDACLPATSFAWQNGTTNYSAISNVGGQDGMLTGHVPYLADFNGDGLADVFWHSAESGTNTRSTGNHTLWTNSGNGRFQVIENWLGQNGTTVSSGSGNCKASPATFTFQPFIADFNRDGRTDIWWHAATCGGGGNSPTKYTTTTLQWFSRPDGSFSIAAGPSMENLKSAGDYYPWTPGLMDVNGDSRPDLTFSGGKTTATVHYWLTQQDATVVRGILGVSSTGSPSVFPVGKTFARTEAIDFNADGVADLLMQKSNYKGIEFLLLGNGDAGFRQVAGADTSLNSHASLYGDLNGDGQTDILWDKQDSSNRSQGNRSIWISRGDGTFTKITNAGGLDGTVNTTRHRPYLADFNGDGQPDVLWDAEDDNYIRSTGERLLWISRGENAFNIIANLNNASGTLVDYAPHLGDFNGDGKTDIFWDRRIEGDNRSQGNRVLWLSDGLVPDLMTGVTSGIGATASFDYKSLSDKAVYTKDVGAADPIVEVQGSLQVVSQIGQTNGIGGERSIAYRYAGAKGHVDGHGYLGFREVTAADRQTNIAQTTTYRQAHPFAGLVAQDVTHKGGVTLSSSTHTHEAVDLGNSRSHVRLKQTVAVGTDNGARLPDTTTTYQYDAYGNATQIAVATSDGFGKTTINTYANDAVNWVLGRLTNATVTSQAPGFASQVPDVDVLPDPFDFTDVGDAVPGAIYEGSVFIAGFNSFVTASVSGGEIRKNDRGDWQTSITIGPGDKLNLRLMSATGYGAAAVATVTVGGVSADWKVVNQRVIEISSNVNNFNLRSAHDSLYPAPTGTEQPPLKVVAIVNPNVIVGSTTTTTPAFDVGNWPAGVPVSVIVKGSIQGKGGNGGNGGSRWNAAGVAPTSGQPGGAALYTRYAINLILSAAEAKIWGGGGGGGGGGAHRDPNRGGGGGGGGAGSTPGNGGPFGTAGGGGRPGSIGTPGTTEAGGIGGGGNGSANDGQSPNGRGGDGGGPGQSGQAGDSENDAAAGTGGAAGAAIIGASFVSQTGAGDIRGPLKNDGVPDAFSFASVSDMFISTVLEASTNLTGFVAPLTATVSGGDARIRKNGTGNWETSVSVVSGDTLNVQMTSSSSAGTTVTAIVRVGATSGTWSISTAEDTGGSGN